MSQTGYASAKWIQGAFGRRSGTAPQVLTTLSIRVECCVRVKTTEIFSGEILLFLNHLWAQPVSITAKNQTHRFYCDEHKGTFSH
jgi:hypothetical protein